MDHEKENKALELKYIAGVSTIPAKVRANKTKDILKRYTEREHGGQGAPKV